MVDVQVVSFWCVCKRIFSLIKYYLLFIIFILYKGRRKLSMLCYYCKHLGFKTENASICSICLSILFAYLFFVLFLSFSFQWTFFFSVGLLRGEIYLLSQICTMYLVYHQSIDFTFFAYLFVSCGTLSWENMFQCQKVK